MAPPFREKRVVAWEDGRRGETVGRKRRREKEQERRGGEGE